MLPIAKSGHRASRLARSLDAGTSLEYAVFAGMLGLTLVIMFQLFGDTLSTLVTSVASRVEATTAAHTGGAR